jgi:hypothetical protein
MNLIYEPGSTSETRSRYANHLWESFAWDRYLEHLTPGRVRMINSNFHSWARPFVEDLDDNFGSPRLGQRWNRLTRRTKAAFARTLSKLRRTGTLRSGV